MDLMREYLNETRLVSHHINSFNDLLANGLQAIVNRERPIVNNDRKIKISFGHIYIENPKYMHKNRSLQDFFPTHARKNNITYEGSILCNITITHNGKTVNHSRVPIGKLPIMLRSNACNLMKNPYLDSAYEECRNDPGGYFIIRGKERVLVGQLRLAYNRVYTYECKPDEKYTYYSEIRSMNAAGNSVLIKACVDSSMRCFFSLPYIKNMLPAGVVFKALNVPKDVMINYVKFPSRCRNAAAAIEELINQYDECATQSDAILAIVKFLPEEKQQQKHKGENSEEFAINYVKSILKNELFYHIGIPTEIKCAKHLAFILKRLVSCAVGNTCVDDKNNLANKRLDSSGNLVAFIFNGLFKQFTKTIATQLENYSKNATADVMTIIKNVNSLYTMSSCFMSSNWTTQKASGKYSREGVSQVLAVQNYGSRLSHLRRIMLPNGVKGKNSNPRQIHTSYISFICPYETPEGERVGLVSNLALSADVTTDIQPCEIEPILETLAEFQNNDYNYQKNQILINGKIIGYCNDPYKFLDQFDKYRNSHLIDKQVSCYFLHHHSEIHVWCDEGRLIRPLFRVNSNDNTVSIPKTWHQKDEDNSIVFRDVEEIEQSIVAIDESDLKRHKCHYMEICPAATMMSVMASVIPFANHSQSPRNAYQASMGKQAIGIPCESYRYRYDTTLHVLNYAQQPITRSEMVTVIKFHEMSHGAMPIVAIMTNCGFNQEDSIILNKSSIDRGMFMSTTYFTIVEEEKKRGKSDFDSFCLPKEEYRRRDVNYSYLDENGLLKEDKSIFLVAGDAIIGKTTNQMVNTEKKGKVLETKDTSIVIAAGEEGYVDSVLKVVNEDGIITVKIRLRKLCIPEIGDKFASSTAQKGTCGMIFSQEDMPFDKDGITPDLIINPHAIPSRMTINMLIEQCLNLLGCISGTYFDATTFAHPNIEAELSNALYKFGFTDYKSELYSGFTGEKYPSKIFMAPAFYQRLKHMVADKIHSRTNTGGPIDKLTHQPVAGRSRDGGLRIGNMELSCCIASGVSRLTKEFMYDLSDKYNLPVCSKCGQIALSMKNCHKCEDGQIVMKNTPYATKFFFQLLQGIGIKLVIE